ncbi:hypothetical protein CDAR_308342 [Caerostris darwini]|uniref:Uncharacterized protein n=1 Tax=Caerostris darwini TaxID=1538125 RepID=A0AAV4TSE0_9ARAC|nr:hypothetical protein CDAR_193611 [Caerostris darwini]GIY49120.1 hypothetical protein CDAR_308342 [Caerostris darwini]
MEPRDVSPERRDFKSFEKEGFQTENDEFNDFYSKFQKLQITTGSVMYAFSDYLSQFEALKLAREKVFDFIKNNWDSSFGELEDFLRENNKLSTSIEELDKKLEAHIHKTLQISATHASDFEAKFKNRKDLVARLTKKKKELKSLLNKKASSKLKIEEIEEDIEVLEETLKNKEHDLRRYVTAPSVKEDFKRFICDLVKHEKEYHKIDMEIFSNLRKIMKREDEISPDENKACDYQKEDKKFQRSSLKRTHSNIENESKKFKKSSQIHPSVLKEDKFQRRALKRTHDNVEEVEDKKFEESSEIHPTVLELFKYAKSSSEESDDDIEKEDEKFQRSLKRTHDNIKEDEVKKFKESSEIHSNMLELLKYAKSSSEHIEKLDK